MGRSIKILQFFLPLAFTVCSWQLASTGKQSDFQEHVIPFLEVHCIECHSGADAEDDLDLEFFLDETRALENAEEWDLIREWVVTRKMPPGERTRPQRKERKQFLAWIDEAFGKSESSLQGFDPGRPVLRRLNHVEYRNTVRDILGVDFPADEIFPAENVGHGFDNIGAALSLPDSLFEQYLDAAEWIADQAIITDIFQPIPEQRFDASTLRGNSRGDVIWLYSNGDATAKWESPREGRYSVKFEAWGQQAGPDPCRLDLIVDGMRIKTVDVKQTRGEPGFFELELPKISKGNHTATARFTNDYYRPDDPDPQQRDRNLAVVAITIRGPLDARPNTEFQDRLKRIPSHKPSGYLSNRQHDQFAAQDLAWMLWRRLPTEGEIKRLMQLTDPNLSFEQNLNTVLQALLLSPQFLFRVEALPAANKKSRWLNSSEMSTRLSYFLWSTVPDGALGMAEMLGDLQKDGVLKGQVERMLADPRARALADNFASQWLRLRVLDQIAVDAELFPSVTPELKEFMKQETLLLFNAFVQENRPIREMLTADFTFLNGPLAKHYGIPGIHGKEMRRVDISQTNRRGLLGHASILTLTSNPTRTSPVKRGKWVMETLLGTAPPPPPAEAGSLDESKVDSAASLRIQFEQHRAKPECASCHVVMDPIGFGLENYDAVGRWRKEESGQAIDNLGVLPDGRTFRGPAELRQLLYNDGSLAETALEQLYIYALGRGLQDSDYPILDQIYDSLSANAQENPTWRDLATGIVLSDAFRKISAASSK